MTFKNIKIALLLILSFTIIGCGNKNKNKESEQSEEEGYKDGTYCAEVDYYYSETGTRSTYTLEVEIENNELTMIHWPNGGWLDDSHFSPPDISSGEASFTSDKGIEYTVRIIGNEGERSLDTYVTDEDAIINKKKETQEQEYRQKQENEEEDRITKEEDDKSNNEEQESNETN
jgi:hypothetical protein